MRSSPKPVPSCALALCIGLLAATPAACTPSVPGNAMSANADHDAAWEQVRSAPDAATQRQRIVEFLRQNDTTGAPALQVLVYRRDTGAQAPIDDALWAHPDQFEVQLSFGERRFRFVPLSRDSLEPLFRE